jgi:hypothetical protein
MTDRRRVARELGGVDPIDSQVGIPQQTLLERAGLGWIAPLLLTRAALGLRPSLVPAVIVVPLGFLLGPRVLNVVSVETLGYLDTVVSVALAVLGVFVGMAFAPHLRAAPRLIAAASLEALLTIATVAVAIAFVVTQSQMPLGVPVALAALCLGISASASSASTADPHDDPAARAASQVADLDDVLPILLSGAVLLVSGSAGPDAQGLAIIAAPMIGLAIGCAGWLLFERAESAAERGALLLGALALLGGAPVYLSASPLVAGFIAGLFWTLAPGRSNAIVSDELRKIQHPLVVLLLVTAGAMCVPSIAAAWLIGPYVLFRICGKLAGAWVAARLSGIDDTVTPFDLGVYLIPPGVIGIAFALGFGQILPASTGALIVTTVAAGSILCELTAFYVLPAGRREP